MAFYLYVLGVLVVGGLLAWNLRFHQRMRSKSNDADSSAPIRFIAFDNTPYLLSTHNHPADCYVKDKFGDVATFEQMSLRGDAFDTLHIDHFALDASRKGQGLGETVLRSFARLVAEQAPQINRITFDLSRYTEESNLLKLTKAREKLLMVIRAREVQQLQPRQDCIRVKGVWYKAQWVKDGNEPGVFG